MAGGEQPQPEILGDVGVLILVDQDRAEPLLVPRQQLRLLRQQRQAVQQQVAEIAGVQRREALLVGGIERDAAAEREVADLGGRHLVRPVAAVLPALDRGDQQARRPAALVEIGRLDDLLGQPLLVVAVQDGEAGLQADQLGMRPQHAHAHGVEGAQPHAGDAAADQPLDALDHLARGAVGEGDRQHLVRPCPAGQQEMGEARRQDAGLAGAGAGQNQQRPVRGRDRRPLLRIQTAQVGRLALQGLACPRQCRWLTAHGSLVIQWRDAPDVAGTAATRAQQRRPRACAQCCSGTPSRSSEYRQGAAADPAGLGEADRSC